jgi:outer membrane lipoprotein SlyB
MKVVLLRLVMDFAASIGGAVVGGMGGEAVGLPMVASTVAAAFGAIVGLWVSSYVGDRWLGEKRGPNS